MISLKMINLIMKDKRNLLNKIIVKRLINKAKIKSKM